MVTITSLAKDERSARVALAATLEPDDAVTGRLIAAVGAVETMRLAAGTGAFPKKVDSVDAGLWRNKVSPRLDARTVTQALSETDRLGLHILIPGDRDWPTALNDLGERAPTVLWVRGTVSFLSATLSDRVTITGARAATSYGAVARGGAGTGDRHSIAQRGAEERDRAAHPQHGRGALAQVVQCGRPVTVAGDEDVQSEAVGLRQCLRDRAGVEAWGDFVTPQPGVDRIDLLRERAGAGRQAHGLDRANRRDEPAGHRVVGLQGRRQGDPCGAFVLGERSDRDHAGSCPCVPGRCASAVRTSRRTSYGCRRGVVPWERGRFLLDLASLCGQALRPLSTHCLVT